MPDEYLMDVQQGIQALRLYGKEQRNGCRKDSPKECVPRHAIYGPETECG